MNAISSVRIASLKFDLNNLDDTGSFPAVVEFKITLLGMKIRYKAKEQKFNFGQELDPALVDTLASSTMDDLENCVESCNNQCCTQLGQCSSEDLFRSKMSQSEATGLLHELDLVGSDGQQPVQSNEDEHIAKRVQEMSPVEMDHFMHDLDLFSLPMHPETEKRSETN